MHIRTKLDQTLFMVLIITVSAFPTGKRVTCMYPYQLSALSVQVHTASSQHQRLQLILSAQYC